MNGAYVRWVYVDVVPSLLTVTVSPPSTFQPGDYTLDVNLCGCFFNTSERANGQGDICEVVAPLDVEQAAPVAPALTIQVNGNNVLPTTTTNVVVGQQINLSVSAATGTIGTATWQIPGTTVGGYTVTYTNSSSPTSTQLVATNYDQIAPTIYWVDGANARTVTVSVTMADGSTGSTTTVFNVAAPTGSMTATPNPSGANAIAVDASCAQLELEQPQNAIWAHYGCPPGNVGISFANTYTVPVSGSFQWVQVADTSLTRTPVGGQAQSEQPSPCVGLDTSYPYNQVYSNPTSDSPANNVSVGYSSFQRSDNFTMTLMYQPTSLPSAIWVPVASVEWSWGYSATSSDGGNTWTLGVASWPGNLSPGATTVFPAWSSNAASCSF